VSGILTSMQYSRLSVSRITNVFVVGEGVKPWISLPKGKGIKLTIAEERDVKRKRAADSQ
jgi:small subunit ribosomal protein S4e